MWWFLEPLVVSMAFIILCSFVLACLFYTLECENVTEIFAEIAIIAVFIVTLVALANAVCFLIPGIIKLWISAVPK